MAATAHKFRHPVAAVRNGRGESRSSYWMFAGMGTRPDPTPPAGPDPYGEPRPEWLGVDWREHLRSADIDGAQVNYA